MAADQLSVGRDGTAGKALIIIRTNMNDAINTVTFMKRFDLRKCLKDLKHKRDRVIELLNACR